MPFCGDECFSERVNIFLKGWIYFCANECISVGVECLSEWVNVFLKE